jgi:hypothetical protein
MYTSMAPAEQVHHAVHPGLDGGRAHVVRDISSDGNVCTRSVSMRIGRKSLHCGVLLVSIAQFLPHAHRGVLGERLSLAGNTTPQDFLCTTKCSQHVHEVSKSRSGRQ